jgi:hypothetical protein
MGSEPVVVEADRVAFELTETITTEESSLDWRTVLVFCVYEERGGGGLTLCEARVEVKHEQERTWVRLLCVKDCYDGRGDLLLKHWRGYAASKHTGRLEVPESGRALLTDERPTWQNLREVVKVHLVAAVNVYRKYGPMPLPRREEVQA